MIKEVKGDKTLLVSGPASVRLLSGEAEIFGALLSVGETIIVRDGKRSPFHVKIEACFDIVHSKDSRVEEVDGDTVPVSWYEVAEEVLALGKPTVVMIMAEVDSGKTGLCTFLVNCALEAKRKVAVIDADLGQSDIGPPTTIGLAYISKPVKDLFHVKANEACFVGFISPRGAQKRVVNCIVSFKKLVFAGNSDFLVINTDGWVESEEAIRYKVMLAEAAAPNVVVGLERENKLASLLSRLEDCSVLRVETPTAVKKRDRENRKALRELSYKKYLKNAKIESFPLSWIKIESAHSLPSLFLTNRRLGRIKEALGVKLVFCEETTDTIWIVLKRNQRLDLEKLHSAEEVLKKKVAVMWKGDEKGLIVGLHDAENKFLGLGIIFDIDYRRKVMRTMTPVTDEVTTIRVGNIKLDNMCREIGTANLWA